jgi:multidrug efflux pump subunit AcrA (membrane-fusion protein)
VVPPVRDPAAKGWRQVRRRPVVLGSTIVVVLILIGGVTAWAASGSGDSGYRMGKVVRASVGSSMTVVGTIEPVADASASFQVSGQVATVSAAVGDPVTAGETLGTLDTTSLSESVSSAVSSLQSDQAKLTEDEDSETSSTASTTTTTTPATSASTGKAGTGSGSGAISQDQATLVADQAASSKEQQQEAADLAQADSTCGISSPTTPSGTTSTSSARPPGGGSPTSTTTTTTTPTTTTTAPTSTNASACTTALELVAADQQSVANDQQTVEADETSLSKALAAQSSSSGSGDTGTPTSSSIPSTTTSSGGATTGRSGDTGGSNSDSPTQIASDEAAIDSAEANVVVAEQSLAEGQLTSPINGTVVSVGITVGDTVSADSSTDVIVIIGTNAFEATATLTSAQVPSVKVDSPAAVSVDGTSGRITGSVSEVGPVQSSDTGYSYPVVVALPSSANKLFSGSSANISIVTGQKKDVLAVPTSAVTTTGTRSSVEVLSSGAPVAKSIKVGIVGSIYTQVISGLKVGDSVVLADYAEPVPASNTSTVGGFGGGGAFTGGGGFGGGGAGRFSGGAVGATSLGG